MRGGGGGGTFKNVFEALLPRLWKKNTGTFFNTKRVDMPNFSRFGEIWKIATKSSFSRADLHGATQLCAESVHSSTPQWGVIEVNVSVSPE